MTANATRRFALFEALAFPGYVALYIWKLQASLFYSWIVFPVWLIASFLLNRDTPRSLGWRADNLWTATKDSAIVFVPCIFGVVLFGLLLGAPRHSFNQLLVPRHFFGYMAFCLLQQVALNSLVTNRLLAAMERPAVASLIAGLLFALLHWPNPVLAPLTGIGGFFMAWLFARDRNILTLTVWQSILGTLVWWAFPLGWHHAMRVGPGFYNFHPR